MPRSFTHSGAIKCATPSCGNTAAYGEAFCGKCQRELDEIEAAAEKPIEEAREIGRRIAKAIDDTAEWYRITGQEGSDASHSTVANAFESLARAIREEFDV